MFWSISVIAAMAAAIVFTYPAWTHSRRWGYYPVGGLSLIFAAFLLFLLFTPRLS
jgi:hypothetical protein